ncbi:hypothetical protein ThidrDRAFT_0644 [Thiorhodococcus drewsii AZ1]|uniref:ATP-binding protein n=1 Tax=Thiorhodococcus drewsii AZ1 TaxID=765913 RepID=G2DX83_9GAMM|nr:ATP-binding protein [Thiorhodococcus drewsii]EGV33437.1 hypothetical protein ThidrDRAFT_0644 [Thiorhodococcus drewsii AZ1]
MRTVIGSPVEGDDFFDRESERRRMWRRLETDSLLLLAPRRIGKTSLMRALCAEGADHGFQAVSLSFAACSDEMHCVRELAKAIAGARELDLSALQQALKGLLPDLKSLKLGPLGIELATGESPDWRDLGEALTRSLGSLDGRWLIAVDEVPVFLLHLLKQDDGLARVRGFLYWLRTLRQDHHAQVRWILAGSIGLDTVAARHGLGDTVNDLKPIPLGAFEPETAERFLQALAESYKVDMSGEVRSHIIAQLGWPVPYYLQILFGELYDRVEDGERLDSNLVDQVFDDLLKPAHKGYFDYWRQRLTEELGQPDDGHATHLLSHCARDPSGASRTTLEQALAERIAEPDSRETCLRYLLDILESDGYLVQLDDRWRFRLELLRRYWLQRVAP